MIVNLRGDLFVLGIVNSREARIDIRSSKGGVAKFDVLVSAFELGFALPTEASGDTRLTPLMHEQVHWTRNQKSQ